MTTSIKRSRFGYWTASYKLDDGQKDRQMFDDLDSAIRYLEDLLMAIRKNDV